MFHAKLSQGTVAPQNFLIGVLFLSSLGCMEKKSIYWPKYVQLCDDRWQYTAFQLDSNGLFLDGQLHHGPKQLEQIIWLQITTMLSSEMDYFSALYILYMLWAFFFINEMHVIPSDYSLLLSDSSSSVTSRSKLGQEVWSMHKTARRMEIPFNVNKE